MANSEAKYPAGLRILVILALVTVIGFGLYQVRDWVAPVFLALTLVLTVRPMHRGLMRHHVPHWVSAVLTLLVIAVVLIGIMTLTMWSVTGFPALVESYSDRFEGYMADVFAWLESLGLSSNSVEDQVMNALSPSTIVGALTQLLTSVMNVGSFVGVLAFALFFLTIDSLRTSQRFSLAGHFAPDLTASLARFEGAVREYWIVATVFGAVVSVIDYFILVILHVPLAAGWSLVAFVTNYIPNVGFIVGVLPPALVGLLHSGWSTAVWVIVLYTVVNVVIQGLVQPKIVGDAVGLSTIVTFISLVFWTTVLGPIGSILAVPLTLFAKALLVDSSPRTRWLDAYLAGESDVAKRLRSGVYEGLPALSAAGDAVDAAAPVPADAAVAGAMAARGRVRNGTARAGTGGSTSSSHAMETPPTLGTPPTQN